MKKPAKNSATELISFRACVVEVEGYKSVVEGKTLYHAVLDSVKDEPQRQAQFFGLSENIFKVGDIHTVTFSRPVAKSKRRAVKPDQSKALKEIAELEKLIN